MLGYNEIISFVNNIYYAKGKKFDTTFSPMWTREILNCDVSIEELHKAEVRIIRENIPLVVSDVCDIIKQCKEVVSLPPTKTKCPYCKGYGIVEGVKFDRNGKHISSAGYALNCVCGNGHIINGLMMNEDKEHNHKTMCYDGYYLIFPEKYKEIEYMQRVKQNNGRDIK